LSNSNVTVRGAADGDRIAVGHTAGCTTGCGDLQGQGLRDLHDVPAVVLERSDHTGLVGQLELVAVVQLVAASAEDDLLRAADQFDDVVAV
jgi:hypothetical protein